MPSPRGARASAIAAFVAALPLWSSCRAQSYYEVCDGAYEQVAESVQIRNGETTTREIQRNHTHRFVYTNYNLTTISLNDTDRKLIISLEPCYGVVYLFVRKNIPCHPDPYSCINLDSGYRDARVCRRTHWVSDINGTRDGAPSFFQIPLSATQYYISIFAAEESRYALTVLDDVGAWPRRGNNGLVQAAVVSGGTVMLQWSIATYWPIGISETKHYSVYAVPLVDNDTRTSDAIFLRPSKILNTNCGLLNNTDKPDDILTSDLCDSMCNTTISGLINGRTYAFNVVAESQRGFRMAYAGAVLGASWDAVTSVGGSATSGSGGRRLSQIGEDARRLMDATSVPMDTQDMQVVGAVMGSVLGMVGMAGLVLLRYAS